jgi:ubiquinone/menaquinone biosynthesis C-methylase UbiE
MMRLGIIPAVRKESRVFEPGCNVGAILKQMHERYGCQVFGLDISEESITFAREIFKSVPGAAFTAGDVLSTEFFGRLPDDYFTLSYSVSHLIHVPNGEAKDRYVSELKRISRCVVLNERIRGSKEPASPGKNFQDYEKEYGFRLFRQIRKRNKYPAGVFYFAKAQGGQTAPAGKKEKD